MSYSPLVHSQLTTRELWYARCVEASRIAATRADPRGRPARAEGATSIIDVAIRLAAVGILVFLNAFFVAAEFALVSLRRSRIEQMVEERHRFGRMLLRAKDDPNRFISAAQLGITMASLGLGWIGESTVAAMIEPLFHGLPEQYQGTVSHTISFAISFTLITMLHIVLGEQVPKMVSLQHAERTAIVTVGPTEAFYRIFRPFIAAFTGLTNVALRLLRIQPASEHEGAVTAEELELMVQTSHRAGALEDTERDLLSNVFDFADLSVYQVMIQRRDMVGVPIDVSLDDLLELGEASPHSRFPVYEESLDNVVGVIHIKDLLRAARRDHDVVRPAEHHAPAALRPGDDAGRAPADRVPAGPHDARRGDRRVRRHGRAGDDRRRGRGDRRRRAGRVPQPDAERRAASRTAPGSSRRRCAWTSLPRSSTSRSRTIWTSTRSAAWWSSGSDGWRRPATWSSLTTTGSSWKRSTGSGSPACG